jgi:YHS domain-containing protein
MILRLIISVVVIYLLYKLVKGWLAFRSSPKTDLPAAGEDLVEDPLCHTYVPVSNALKSEFAGKTVYFCSRKCLELYKEQRKG